MRLQLVERPVVRCARVRIGDDGHGIVGERGVENVVGLHEEKPFPHLDGQALPPVLAIRDLVSLPVALVLAPEDLFIVDSMGWTLYRLGDLPRAVEFLRRAWKGRPDGEIGAHLGEVLWVAGDRAEAERIWQEAVKTAPENEALQKTIKRFKP